MTRNELMKMLQEAVDARRKNPDAPLQPNNLVVAQRIERTKKK